MSVYRENLRISEFNLGSDVPGQASGPLTFLIGRSKSCPITLDHPQVSREHAQINYGRNGWKIKKNADFSSLVINGNLVEEKDLVNGDLITIGPFVLQVSIAPEEKYTAPLQTVDVGPVADKKLSETGPLATPVAAKEVEPVGDPNVTPALAADASVEDQEFKISPDAFGDNLATPEGGEAGMDMSKEGDAVFALDQLNAAVGSGMDLVDAERTAISPQFAKFELELFGEHAPYDRYQLEKVETFIGRDPQKCQIVLKDSEVSTAHAVLRKNNITCTLEDLGSSNGTLLNGVRINKSILTNGDEFVIGNTTFTVRVISDFLDQERGRLMPVEENQIKEIEEIVEVSADFATDGGVDTKGIPIPKTSGNKYVDLFREIWNDKTKRKRLIMYGSVAIILLLVLLPTDDGKDKKVDPNKKEAQNKDPKKGGLDTKLKDFTPEQMAQIEPRYLLAKELFEQGKYGDSMIELDKVVALTGKDREYKNTKQLVELSKQGLERLEQLEQKKRAEIEKKEREEKVKQLVVKAKDAVKDHKATLAHALFDQIMQITPENFDVPLLKTEIESWEKEQERVALEKAQKEAERKRQLEALNPGKSLYLQKDWYRAGNKLADFLKMKNLDEDLIKDASTMLSDTKNKLQEIIGPLLGKARSLREGQDLKGAYEVYGQTLLYDPANTEAISEMSEIREKLYAKSRKIYRDAIISESLSLFPDAKEKFQEVQQISPTDSEYYMKATRKLENYTE
ncbi:MAG: FHA domain-containing protein [Pseudomonadota bacterium]